MSLRRLALGAMGAALLAVTAPVLAGNLPPVGTKVRLTVVEGTRSRRVIGVVQGSDSTNVFLQPANSPWFEPFAWRSVRAVEVSVGQHAHTWTGLGLGVASGAAAGALIGYASGDDPAGWFSLTAGEKAGILAVVLGFAGGITGVILGATSRGDTWRPYPEGQSKLQPVVRPDGSGLALGVAFRF